MKQTVLSLSSAAQRVRSGVNPLYCVRGNVFVSETIDWNLAVLSARDHSIESRLSAVCLVSTAHV
jgi:hypothetical protein